MSFDAYTPPSSEPVFTVQGSLGRDGTVQVTSVRGQNSSALLPPDVPSDVELVLIDANHRELARSPLCRHLEYAVLPRPASWKPGDSVGSTTFDSASFSAHVPAYAGGVALVIRRGSMVLWTQAIDRSRPTVALLSCETLGDSARVTWTRESDTKTRPRMSVEFSIPSRLEDWRSISSRTHADDSSATEFDLIELPPGRVQIRLALDDGFYTTHSNAVELDVPDHPLEIEIRMPVAAVVPEGLGKLSVRAVAREWHGHALFDNGEIHDADAYQWMLDNGSLGRGSTILIDPPPLGPHTLTATVKWKNKEARASIAFEMTDELLAAVALERPRILALRQLFPHIAWGTSIAPPPRSASSRLMKFLDDFLSRHSPK